VAWILSRILGASVRFRVGGWKCLRDVVVKFNKVCYSLFFQWIRECFMYCQFISVNILLCSWSGSPPNLELYFSESVYRGSLPIKRFLFLGCSLGFFENKGSQLYTTWGKSTMFFCLHFLEDFFTDQKLIFSWLCSFNH